jgi:hypothetical protein
MPRSPGSAGTPCRAITWAPIWDPARVLTAPTSRAEEEPVRTAVAQLKDRFAIRDRRAHPIHPEEEPAQLELAV